jgi:hypothetical protein
MVWATDSKQTGERLHAALDTYRRLPPMPSAGEPIRAEAQIMKNTEKLPRSELLGKILEMTAQGSVPSVMWMRKLWVDVVATPWELARTDRAFRVLYASKIKEAEADPGSTSRNFYWRRGVSFFRNLIISPGQILREDTLKEIEVTTPLVQPFSPLIDRYIENQDSNNVERRALVQILALRTWQLGHDGRLPGKLQELVTSGLLNELPADPYWTGRHFGYVRSSGQPLLPLGERGPVGTGSAEHKRPRPTAGFWLLYSIGPDRRDDEARTNETTEGSGDIVFPLADSTTSTQKGSPH